MTPVMAMVWVTIVVWVVLFVRRVAYISANKIDAQDLYKPERTTELLPDDVNNPANNFKNLFEVPVLFYVVCFALFLAQQVDSFYVYSAWTFVALRAVHSVIQCSYNNVNHRFAVYALSSLLLWVMAGRFFLALIA